MSNLDPPGKDVELHDFPESEAEAAAYIDGDDDARNLNEVSAIGPLPFGMNPPSIITDGGVKEYSTPATYEEKSEQQQLQHAGDRAPAPPSTDGRELSDVTVENEPKEMLVKPGKEAQRKIPYWLLLTRFSTGSERFLMFLGLVAATGEFIQLKRFWFEIVIYVRGF